MKPYQTEIAVREGQSGAILLTVRDENGDLVPTSSIDAITLDLYRWHNGAATVINDRDAVSVLNENGGTYFDTLQTASLSAERLAELRLTAQPTYNFRWDYTPADTPFLGDDTTEPQVEKHIAHVRFTWDDEAKAIGHEVVMKVTNFRRFPTVEA